MSWQLLYAFNGYASAGGHCFEYVCIAFYPANHIYRAVGRLAEKYAERMAFGPIGQGARRHLGRGVFGRGNYGDLEIDLIAPCDGIAADGQRLANLTRRFAVVQLSGYGNSQS